MQQIILSASFVSSIIISSLLSFVLGTATPVGTVYQGGGGNATREAVHIKTTCKTCRHSQYPERTRWYPCKDYERKEDAINGRTIQANLHGQGGSWGS